MYKSFFLVNCSGPLRKLFYCCKNHLFGSKCIYLAFMVVAFEINITKTLLIIIIHRGGFLYTILLFILYKYNTFSFTQKVNGLYMITLSHCLFSWCDCSGRPRARHCRRSAVVTGCHNHRCTDLFFPVHRSSTLLLYYYYH